MPFALLQDRAVIVVSGPEAEHFLQNIVTVDLDALKDSEVKPGALLAPQGKILFDFLISRIGPDAFRLECPAEVAEGFHRRLLLYKLRTKAEITKPEQKVVTVAWQDDSSASGTDSTTLTDTRFAVGNVKRSYGATNTDESGDPDAWHAFRIANGVAESGLDYQLGDAFPHDVLLDQTGGVGFAKGCYVGQEVVSRMQHRGTARRRVLIASAETALPAAGTELTVEGRPVGTLGSVSGKQGLAIARIDRVKNAVDAGKTILAGDVPVTLAIPGWAKFTFPEDATSSGSS
ncbi:CAF17-like 4Fe-4S cluster assembly/insertion protein YgfZ [Aquamicrobium ahrensii]|uniref:Folate-binding protein YgfZ n=1 Tax=Aquamicrobium ahrensii TaxID=469551 RepID=A0ABV2KMM1_9HYPH